MPQFNYKQRFDDDERRNMERKCMCLCSFTTITVNTFLQASSIVFPQTNTCKVNLEQYPWAVFALVGG
jgi:hypothetical protein